MPYDFRRGIGFVFALSILCSIGTPPVFAQTSSTPKRASQPVHISRFYDTPDPLPPGKPGGLIRSSPANDYFLSADFSAFRILYHSRSATGQDVAVSGVVLVPYGKPPKGGWPVLAWSHAFMGAGRQCAPSLLRNLYYGPFFAMYIGLGYAVVATDYAGLGTTSRNAAMDVPSNAANVIDSIPAARAAVPELGSRWIAMGPYQGASVAIAVAEMENQSRDPNFLGAVAISGVTDWKDVLDRLSKPESLRTLSFLAYGIKTVHPDFDVRDMLSAKAMQSYDQLNESCGIVGNSPNLPVEEILKPNWKADHRVQDFFERNTLGRTSAFGPIYVIADEGDPAVASWMTAQVVTRLCKQSDKVQFDKFRDAEPGRVIGGSARDQMNWIEARFAGRAAPTNCP